MALIPCSECGKEISDKAMSCPHCGCPSQSTSEASKEPAKEEVPAAKQKKRTPQYGDPLPSREPPKSTSNQTKGCIGCFSFLVILMIVGAIGSCVSNMGRDMKLSSCNSGNDKACLELLDDSTFADWSKITNKSLVVANKKKEKAAAAIKKLAAKMAAKEMENRMAKCEMVLRNAMKDPDSFRVHDRDYDRLLITYSATNSFGARLRKTMNCMTGKNLGDK